MNDLSRSSFFDLRQLGSHKWQNLIGLENLKIPGFHFYGTMKLFTKVHDSATFVGHIPVILKLIFILSFLYAFQDNSSPGRKELIEREQTKKYIYTF